MKFKRKQGESVLFKLGGDDKQIVSGKIVGLAQDAIPTLGEMWMVKLDKPLDKTYPFDTVPCFEIFIIKTAQPVATDFEGVIIKPNQKPYKLVRMDWDESEAGWGVRPDGYSLHISEEDYNVYLKEYWKRMPKNTPHEYSRPGGYLKKVQKSLTDKEYQSLVKHKGLRYFK